MYASFVLRPPRGAGATQYAAALPLAAGIAVAETVAAWLPEGVELRWPNDCDWRDRKLAGTLVEGEGTGGTLDVLICGIGINANHHERDFPPDLIDRATSLRAASGDAIDLAELASCLALRLATWDDICRCQGMAPVRRRWLELSPGARGCRVVVQTGSETIEGVTEGLDERGGLRVRCEGETRVLISGEVLRVRQTL